MTQTVLLGDIVKSGEVTIHNRLRAPLNSRQRSGMQGVFPYYGATGQMDAIDQYRFDGFYILVAEDGTVYGPNGICPMIQRVRGKFWVSNHAHVLKGDDEVDTKYLALALESADVRANITGAVQLKLSKDNLFKIKINWPPRNEREAILRSIDPIDEKIELNRQMNETLEQMGQALFRHHFIDNPEADKWEDGVISDLVNIYSGYAFKRTEFDANGKYGLVTIKNVQDGSFTQECSDHLSNVPEKMPEYAHLQTGDVLLSLTGNVGRVCVVNGKNLLLNQRVAKLEDKNGGHSFVYFMFRQVNFKDKLVSMSRGTAQLNLSPVETKNIKIKIPSIEAIAAYHAKAELLFENIVENNQQTQTLTTLRDTLLPRLISGEVEV